MKIIIEYVCYGILLIAITVYRVNESFPNLFPFENISFSWRAYVVFLSVFLLLNWWASHNRVQTYQREYRRWLFGVLSCLYFVILLHVVPLFTQIKQDDAFLRDPFYLIVWTILAVSFVKDWRKLQERKSSF